jgi:hypothetical protein
MTKEESINGALELNGMVQDILHGEYDCGIR